MVYLQTTNELLIKSKRLKLMLLLTFIGITASLGRERIIITLSHSIYNSVMNGFVRKHKYLNAIIFNLHSAEKVGIKQQQQQQQDRRSEPKQKAQQKTSI